MARDLDRFIRLLAVVVPLFCTSSTSASDWPSFRGPERTDVSNETDLLQRWPEGGPPLVWKVETTGRGYSSVAIVGDKIFTLGDGLSTADDKDEYLICLDRQTGKEVWKTKTGSAWDWGHASWHGSRRSPGGDGDSD